MEQLLALRRAERLFKSRIESYILVMTVAQLATIEHWFLGTSKVSTNSLARLSGDNSLQFACKEFCQSEGVVPMGIKQFAKTVELLIARHFDVLFTKTRDGKEVFFKEMGMKGRGKDPLYTTTTRNSCNMNRGHLLLIRVVLGILSAKLALEQDVFMGWGVFKLLATLLVLVICIFSL